MVFEATFKFQGFRWEFICIRMYLDFFWRNKKKYRIETENSSSTGKRGCYVVRIRKQLSLRVYVLRSCTLFGRVKYGNEDAIKLYEMDRIVSHETDKRNMRCTNDISARRVTDS